MSPLKRTIRLCAIAVLALSLAALLPAWQAPQRQKRLPAPTGARPSYRQWNVYGGGPESIRYSTLDQINRANVRDLEVAWTFDTGDAFEGSEMQCNPIVVEGVIYLTSPRLRVFALDAASGTVKWVFDPNEGRTITNKTRNRGVTYWEGGGETRLFVAAGPWLYGLDARTGKPAPGFGENGRVDLRRHLGREAPGTSIGISTPGIVYRDLLITGSILSEGLPAAPGDIRAFDARTGELRWRFHTIPHPGEFGYDTWTAEAWKYIGGANNWSGMSLDEERGLVFAPTGSAAFDFYGANRVGDNLFANSLIALNAATGERVWHFQFVRHDVWDRDLPAPPNLVTVRRGGRDIPAVAQITKSGHVFLFDRLSGKPLFPVEDRPAPASDVEGEVLARTQPFLLKPAPFARQRLTPDMATKRTPEAHRAVLEELAKLRNDGPFTPPSREGTVIFPGFDGGGEWGGAAWDPATRLFYVNSNEMPWILRLVERKAKPRAGGRDLYVKHCASCHREDLRGTPPEFPALGGIGDRRTQAEVAKITREGSGRMPGFAHLGDDAVRAITRFVLRGEDVPAVAASAPSPIDLKYTHDGYNKFLDPEGYPAVEPPWGTLNAINLDTGEYAWKIPFGEFPELVEKGIRNTGSENYGGPVVTAGGLLFIGATNHDRKFRAYDKANGKLLWETLLPAGGNATPATYMAGGRQFVVIGAGGGKSGRPSGGSYVAFALPQRAIRK